MRFGGAGRAVFAAGAGVHFVLEQSAIDVGVEKRESPAGCQADLLCQVEVARKDVSGRALALLLEKVANPLVDLLELGYLSHPLAVFRVHHNKERRRRQRGFGEVADAKLDELFYSGVDCVLPCSLDRSRVDVGGDDTMLQLLLPDLDRLTADSSPRLVVEAFQVREAIIGAQQARRSVSGDECRLDGERARCRTSASQGTPRRYSRSP